LLFSAPLEARILPSLLVKIVVESKNNWQNPRLELGIHTLVYATTNHAYPVESEYLQKAQQYFVLVVVP